jgi:magnesium and cobalt transporter
MPDGGDTNLKKQNLFSKIFSYFNHKNSNELAKNEHALKNDNEDSLSHYHNLKAEDIMIPRIDIVGIDYTSSIQDICNVFIASRHTRMPVYKNDLDSIVGFINIKDVFPYICDDKLKNNFNIDKIIRQMLVVSPSMKILNLLEEMKKTRTHIAMVIDEFGGSDGLITIEDLVEEIIGEIEDEYDLKVQMIKEIKPNLFEILGRTEIELVAEKLNVKFDAKELNSYDTIGGLVLSISGHVPEKGEKISHAATGFTFEIVESEPRRIKKLLAYKTT